MSAGRTQNTQSQSWGTPKKYVKAVKDFFNGNIALDPCSNKYSIVNANVEYILPQNDGLFDSWNFPTIYVNPPYGSDKVRKTTIKNWLKRCSDASEIHGSEVIALVPVATNTGHWKNYVYPKASAICLLYDTRLKFLEDGKDTGKGAPMSCCLIYWGERYDDFFNHFLKYGAVIDIRPLRDLPIGIDNNLTLQFTND
ncbi:phage N-6-adenine-methyltransferase [Chryseobacterium sp. VAUSW3]|uniref:phage N-6-adenine-methyltransferase n=1 Tax=Chryseobacterium sp. VAUSW3 TaxID=2010998 RepID=UPI001E5B6B6D|nr:phage N-6-adenine-methyltransferase [Chryseobacterium sp. VAUSW3]